MNEEGREAAVVTAIDLNRCRLFIVRKQRAEFRADHPSFIFHLYFIIEDGTGAILFMGRHTGSTE